MKINNKDNLLLFGVILAPMTGLRIWKIGPGELLVFIWCILNIKKTLTLKANNYNIRFWFLIMSLMTLGAMYSLIFYPNQVLLTHLFTWAYLMFISLSIYQALHYNESIYNYNFFKKIIIYSILWYFFLYVYSIFIGSSFLGAPLWYGGSGFRFSGGATNPHQVAVLFGVSIPLLLKELFTKNIFSYKVFILFLTIIAIFLGVQTKAATLEAAIFISLIYLIYKKIAEYSTSKYSNKIAFISAFILMLIIWFVFKGNIQVAFINWLESDPNGIGRLDIFSTIPDTLNKNWLFGLGPGSHAGFGNYEYHNTYLEILAMSGILGLLVFIIYSFKINKITKDQIYFRSAILSMYVYGLAGFSMRRLIYWSLLMFMLVISEQDRCKKKKELLNEGESSGCFR